jgi:lipopolysaccharide biosynthesis regulator YciM
MEEKTARIVVFIIIVAIVVLCGWLAKYLDNHKQFKDSPKLQRTYFKTVHNDYDMARNKEVAESDDWDFYIEVDEKNLAVRHEREVM